MRSPVIPTLLLAFLLVGCSDTSSKTGPGGLSAEDAKALDEAAAKLDAEAAGDASDSEAQSSQY